MNYFKKIIFILFLTFSGISYGQVVINEIMFMPGTNYSVAGGDNTSQTFQSMYNSAGTGQEWIELYNPSPCATVDLSCYLIGSNTSSSNSAAFALPAGTTIPPLGFLVIGGANAPNVDINLSTLVGTPRHIGSSRWHMENGCGYIVIANPSGAVIDAVYWSQNDANDLTAGTTCGGSFDNTLSVPTVCSPTTNPLPMANAITGIEYAGNFGATAQGTTVIGKTLRRATDGSTTWGLSGTGGTPKACNGVCAVNTSLVLNTLTNNSPICSGNAIFTLNGTPNATVTYTINGGANQTVVLDASGNATVTITNPSATVTMQLISINDATCTVNLSNSSVVTIGAANSGVITGDQTLCANASTAYASNGTTGGTWSSSNTAVATVNSSGVVTAVSTGTATISYTVGTGACQSTSSLLVSVSDPLQGTITSTDNSNCGTSGGLCTYTGPSVVINELMIDKSGGNTIVARSNLSAGDEWIELYNPNPCQSIDLGCYMLGNYSNESSGVVSEQAVLFLPPGTTIPPLGFLTIGGANSNANLRPNDLINGLVGNRLYLPGGIFEGGWIGIFDTAGTPIDAVYWMDPSRNINSSVATLSFTTSPGTIAPGAAPLSCPYSGTLPTARAIANASGPIARIGGIAQDSKFQSRTSDAGITWSFNIATSTQGACNATCATPFVPTTSCNGTATATPTNGTAPFSYLWNAAAANQTTQTATGLCAGNYSVLVTDANGCQTTLNVTVLDAPIAAPTYTAIQPTCSTPTGSVTVATPINGATTTYTITGISPVVAPVTNATGIFTGLNTGTYEVIANVGSCVTPVSSIIINAIPVLSAPTVSITQPTCLVGSGSVTVTTPANSPSTTYTITGISPVVAPVTNATGIFIGLNTGTYEVIATDGSCVTPVTPITIDAIPTSPVITTLTATSPVCNGAAAVFTLSGTPNAIVTYTVNGTASQTIVLDVAGNATVSVSNATADVTLLLSSINLNGCSSVLTNTATVVVNALPTASLSGTTTICSGGAAALTINLIGVQPWSVTYTDGATPTTISGITTSPYVLNVTPNTTTTYTLQSVVDANCSNSANSSVTVTIADLAVLIDAGCQEADYVLVANATPSTGIVYEWKDITNTVIGTSSTYTATTAGTYTVTISQGSCSASDTVTVSSIYCDIPRGISPNNDGDNDFFDLSNFDIKDLKIFNRYGTEVYNKSNYKKEWNGTTNSGNELPDGTYFYAIEFASGKSRTGWVYLIRQR